jgi:hypothetical protein
MSQQHVTNTGLSESHEGERLGLQSGDVTSCGGRLRDTGVAKEHTACIYTGRTIRNECKILYLLGDFSASEFMCRCFGTLCSIFIILVNRPMKMEQSVP